MTERGRGALSRDERKLLIGSSILSWDSGLIIDFDETCAPLPRHMRGRIKVEAATLFDHAYPLDARARHYWRPIMPRAPVSVALAEPELAWRGEAYVDSNFGEEPLEDGFTDWRWSRAHLRRDTAVLYEGKRRDGTHFANAFRFGVDGNVSPVDLLPEIELPRTGWRMPRITRADSGSNVTIRRTWEDTPFYARTALSTHMFGEAADAVHESLSLSRLRLPAVRAMLPFRMPRVFW